MNFNPTCNLGNRISLAFLFINMFRKYNKQIAFFSDIVSLRNLKAAETNPFDELGRWYCNKANVQPSSFIFDSETNVNSGVFSFNFNMILLPHQIFILPITYFEKLSNDAVLMDLGIKQYSNEQLR